jgi:SAM-dependent methyltransferase
MKCKVCYNSMSIKYQKQKDINFKMTNKYFDWYECNYCGLLSIASRNKDTPKENLSEYYLDYTPVKGKIIVKSNKWVEDKISINIRRIKELTQYNKKSLKIIDVGCGSGEMLINLHFFLKNVILSGLDYNTKQAIRNVKNLPISLHQGGLDCISNSCKFDVIINSQLLEHLDDPKEFILFIKKHSTKDTIVLTDIPNLNSLSYKIFKNSWVHIDTPRHRNLFTVKSLYILFDDFKVSNFHNFGSSYSFISSLKLKYNIPIYSKFIIIRVFNKVVSLFLSMFIKADDKIHFTTKQNTL